MFCTSAYEMLGDSLELLLNAVSTVLWGHLGVYDDHLITYLRQMLLDNVLSNANQDSQLAKRWTAHNDIIMANDNGTLSSATSTQVYYIYTCLLYTSDAADDLLCVDKLLPLRLLETTSEKFCAANVKFPHGDICARTLKTSKSHST